MRLGSTPFGYPITIPHISNIWPFIFSFPGFGMHSTLHHFLCLLLKEAHFLFDYYSSSYSKLLFSCSQQWMVNGEICIGLFALRDIKKVFLRLAQLLSCLISLLEA